MCTDKPNKQTQTDMGLALKATCCIQLKPTCYQIILPSKYIMIFPLCYESFKDHKSNALVKKINYLV